MQVVPMEEDGNHDARLLPGYRFCPLDKELILYYLCPKVNGQVVPGQGYVIFDLDLYGNQEPWEIWERFKAKRANDLEKNSDLYFFTELKTKTSTGSRFSRTVGKGTWKGDDAGKKISAPGTKRAIGYKKRFRYENKQDSCRHNKQRWIMLEYDLDESLIHNKQGKKYVLNILRKLDDSEKKRKQGEDEEMVEDVNAQGKRQRLQPAAGVVDDVPVAQVEPSSDELLVAELEQLLEPCSTSDVPATTSDVGCLEVRDTFGFGGLGGEVDDDGFNFDGVEEELERLCNFQHYT